jgi:hypothetical protein
VKLELISAKFPTIDFHWKKKKRKRKRERRGIDKWLSVID